MTNEGHPKPTKAQVEADKKAILAEEKNPPKEVAPVEEKADKALQTLDDMRKNLSMGMKQVDPNDIRPPRVILVQNIKDKTELKDNSGKECPDGSYFNSGTNEIFEKLDCYFIYAKKGVHVNKLHEDWGELPKYDAIAVNTKGKMFAITFKNTSRNALSKVFTAVSSQRYPMFAFKCSLETKMISDDGKSWYISVVRVGEIEPDQGRLNRLMKMAQRFDILDVEFDKNGVVNDEEDYSENLPF